jgi:hypothetical protein
LRWNAIYGLWVRLCLYLRKKVGFPGYLGDPMAVPDTT